MRAHADVNKMDLKTYSIITFFITPLSIVSNIYVMIFVITLKKTERSFFMISKISLAVTDLIFAVLILVSSAILYISPATAIKFNAVLYVSIKYLTCTSFYSLSLMALLRFYAIVYPFQYGRLSKKKQWFMIAAVWALGIPAVVVHIIYYSTRKEISLYTDVYAEYLPVSVTLASTCAMCMAYLMSKRNVGRLNVKTAQCKNDSKLFMATFLIIFCCSVTSLPYIVYATLETNVIYSLSGVSDVLVYSVLDLKFRTFVKLTTGRLFACHKPHGDGPKRINSIDVTKMTDLTTM